MLKKASIWCELNLLEMTGHAYDFESLATI